ncbi:ABC transporter permease subunit [Planococcus sp. X10-3]|uniref:ABC transporter permease subunit n=1 Tax=Planococcus sp. X10-3 TaxID=3061240 RepID=UPI003BAE6FFF
MNKTLIAGLIITGITLFIIAFGPHLPMVHESSEPVLPYRDSDGLLMPPPYPPSEDFLIGSNRKGQDLFTILMIGARETFLIIGTIVLLRIALALMLGISAFYSRSADYAMRTWNSLFSFLPTIFIVLIILAIPFIMFAEHRSFWVVIVLAVIESGRVAAVLNTSMHDLKKRTFMEAAIVNGGTPWSMFRRYYWPALRGDVLTAVSAEMSRTMFLIAQLGVIGVFITQEFMSQLDRSYLAIDRSNSWPTLFETLRHDVYSAQWIPVAALGAISFTMIGFYFLAEGLRERKNIQMRKLQE